MNNNETNNIETTPNNSPQDSVGTETSLYSENSNKKNLSNLRSLKTPIFIIVSFIVVAVSLVSIVEIVLDRKFENGLSLTLDQDTIIEENSNQDSTSDSSGEGTSDTPPASPLCDSGIPLVQVVYPNGGETIVVGDQTSLRWELCGVSASLLDSVVVEYFNPETQALVGSFELSCLAELSSDQVSIIWDISPYLEKTDHVGCKITDDVDFLDEYIYKLRVFYANNSYQDMSDNFFMIDATNYVYTAPTFSEYTESATSFTPADALDANTSPLLKEKIFPSFFQVPANFGSYYRMYSLECGVNCLVGVYAIDLRDGRAYTAPKWQRFVTNPSSRLYAVEYYQGEPGTPANFMGRDVYVVWYEFKEESKEFVFVDDKLCSVIPGAGEGRYADCIQL